MITLLRWLLRLLYRFQAFNTEVLKTPGPVLLLPNHVSWWDWLLIGVCLEKDWRFVTSSAAAETSWIHKRIMVNRRTFSVDINSPYAVKHMAEYLHKGGRLVLFPEGRISTTGSLMKLFEGTGFLISRTGAKVITSYIRGAQRLPFSRNPDMKVWFPKLSVHFSNVLQTPSFPHCTQSVARGRVTEWLRDQMVRQHFETEMQLGPATLPEAILEAARLQPGRVVLQDSTLKTVNYRRLLLGASLLSDQWRDGAMGEHVGVLLPNVNAFPVTLLSVWSAGKVPAILNYTSGVSTMLACARVAGIRRVITSRAFLEKARLDISPFREAGIEILTLEDAREKISGANKFAAMARQFLGSALPTANARADSGAAILFTSGSEGEPKAVELTHRNLLANIRQMLSVVDLVERDRFFNALPLFHSFGLAVGLLLPLVHRVFVFLYLSPLHYRVVPAAFYNMNCTVLFGTNTFLSGYSRKAHPYDFHTLRYVFAGAEKLQDSTTDIWMRKFGVRILEGYGATECSPCVSVNLPTHPCRGSAGRLLPGIEYKLEPVEGVPDGAGRLFVRGPNIMRGYLNPEPNAKFQALGGWYDTGDIVQFNEEGCLFVLGRLKRFAKISGEMVSLGAVEEALAGAFPHYGNKFNLAIISKPDENKGEKLIAVTNDSRLRLDEVREAVRAKGLSNLAAPREVMAVPEIPLLGTGKVNYRELAKRVT